MKTVSYGILSFNRKEKLNNLLNKLVATKITDSEIIVVDNGSVDGTQDLAGVFKNVRFIFNPTNTGVSKGWNTLVRSSESPITFIFNDDYSIIEGGWEQIYLDTIKNKIGIMSFPKTGTPLGVNPYTDWVKENRGNYCHNFRLFGIPKEIHEKIRGFDENYNYGYEDTAFNMAAFKLGYPLLEISLGKSHIQHLRDTAKTKDIYDIAKEKIHAENYQKNTTYFYKQWPNGV